MGLSCGMAPEKVEEGFKRQERGGLEGGEGGSDGEGVGLEEGDEM